MMMGKLGWRISLRGPETHLELALLLAATLTLGLEHLGMSDESSDCYSSDQCYWTRLQMTLVVCGWRGGIPAASTTRSLKVEG